MDLTRRRRGAGTRDENTDRGTRREVHGVMGRTSILEGLVNALTDRLDISSFEVGDLKTSARPTPSRGWLLCDGSEVLRENFSALFDAIGTAYGAGNGTTTFNIPDFRQRGIMGAGNSAGLTTRLRGHVFGAENVALNQAETGLHDHPVGALLATNTSTGGTVNRYVAIDTAHPTVGKTGERGAGIAHNNMPPFAVANVFIKYF